MTTEMSRDVLNTASILATAEDAQKMIRRALKLPETNHATDDLFPDERQWSRMPTAAKLIAIGKYLRSECYALADVCDRLVTVPDPLATVGTRD